MESYLQPDKGTVKANPIPTMSYLAASARANAGLALTPGVFAYHRSGTHT